jgi:hypothetical protein
LFWFNCPEPSGASTHEARIISNRSGDSSASGWSISIAPVGYVALEICDGVTRNWSLRTGSNVCNETWHFIVFTIDGSLCSLYLDDELDIAEDTYTFVNGGFAESVLDTFIGARASQSYYYSGYLGLIQVYNRVLSSFELKYIHNITAANYNKEEIPL